MDKSRRDFRHYNCTVWPTHSASLAYALDLRIYYIKNKVDDKCFTKNFLFIIYIPLFIKEKC